LPPLSFFLIELLTRLIDCQPLAMRTKGTENSLEGHPEFFLASKEEFFEFSASLFAR
jgi:hypothetical protein